MQYVMRFRVTPRRTAEFRSWLQQHDADLHGDLPEGWTYAGAYFVVRGFGDYDCELRWDLDDYAALGSENPPTFNQIVKEWQEFVSDASPVEAALLKRAEEVVIIA